MPLRAIIFLCLMMANGVVFASEALLRDFLANNKTLQAEFTQKIVDETGMVLDYSSGVVYLSRPGRFRWDYSASEGESGQQLVADGESIYLFDPDLEQVTQRSMQDAINQVPGLLLVQDDRALEQFFAVSDIGVTDGLSWVALKPLASDATFQQLLLAFDGGVLTVIQLVDSLGNETRLDLSQVVLDGPLPADLFVFDLPAGVDLLRE